MRSFCTSNKTITRINRQQTQWEKIFESSLLDKRLIFRIYKELKKLSNERTNNSLNQWENDLTDNSL
jgi:hypothetical protein